jgi:hypothetical protein
LTRILIKRLAAGALLVLLLALASLSGCGKKPFASTWKDRDVVIDGRDTEWQDARVAIDDAGIGLGLLNDGEHFFISLILSKPMVQSQVLRRGFTVWFDPKGKTNKTFGIRFPLGVMEQGMERMESGAGVEGIIGGRGGGIGGGRRGSDFLRGQIDPRVLEEVFERVEKNGQMEILGPSEEDRRRLFIAEGQEIQLKMLYEHGRLVYELQVPLGAEGIGAVASQTIGVGFEVPKLDIAAMQQRRSGMGGGIGGMGGVGGMGGRRGGELDGISGDGRGRGIDGRRDRRISASFPKPFQLWTKVRLAAGRAE